MGWRIFVNFICQPMLKLKTHSGFHDLFLKYTEEHLIEIYLHENLLILVALTKVNNLSICISIANVHFSVHIYYQLMS